MENRRVVYQNGDLFILKPRNIKENVENGGSWADQGAKKSPKAVYDALNSGKYSFWI